jgi:hypothetical protein
MHFFIVIIIMFVPATLRFPLILSILVMLESVVPWVIRAKDPTRLAAMTREDSRFAVKRESYIFIPLIGYSGLYFLHLNL